MYVNPAAPMLRTLLLPRSIAAILLCGSVAYVIGLQACGWLNPERAIFTGDRREGVLRASDKIRSELPHGPEARWSFQGRDGQKITVAAESYEFDVYLLLLDPAGRQIGWSDNNAGFSNARIESVVQSNGRYTVVICGANADQFGTYWLSLDEDKREVDLSQGAAESYYGAGIDWGRRFGSLRANGWLGLGMGRHFAQRCQWDQAEKYYVESLARAEQDNFTYCQWAASLELGRLFARRRHYDQAAGAFERASELGQKLHAREESEMLAAIEFGNMYHSSARGDLAKVFSRINTTRVEQYALPSTFVKLQISLNEFLQSEDKQKAVDYAEKAYAFRTGLDASLELKATNMLAGTYLFFQPERSRDGWALASQAQEKAHRLGCVDDEIAALTLMSMAKYAEKDTEGMIKFARQAFELTNPQDENPNPRRIALQLQADGEMARGNHQAALEWCLKALQTVESAWARETIDELRRELLSQSRAICTQIISNLYALNARHHKAEYVRQAFDYTERSRSRSLLEELLGSEVHKDTRIDPRFLARDQELLDKISSVRGELVSLRTSASVSRDTLYRLQEQRSNLIDERIRLRAEIANSIGNPYRTAQLSPLTAEQVQQGLSEYWPNSVILYYQLGIRESFLIVLGRNSYHFFKLPDWTTISEAVREWQTQISSQQSSSQSASSNKQYEQTARRLYDILVRPAANLIKGHDLIIVPSDSLCALAFESLVVSRPTVSGTAMRPKYLVEQHAICYAPSISVLAEIEARGDLTAPGKQILLLGDVAGEGNDNKVVRGEQSTAAASDGLPAARREVIAIAQLAERNGIAPTIWLGSEAKEGRFKAADLLSFRFIHIATHAISDHQEGESSALTLSPDSNGNPDGILTSDEIAKLKLNSDLVVLSGCETSIGQEGGAEGIVGFNRRFLIAGTKCVCGSLWFVEDAWTEKLMTTFYRNLIVGRRNKGQALRLAKMELMKLGANPSQWAPFILVGSPR